MEPRRPGCKCISELFQQAGFKAPVLRDIRSEIWLKLWGNLSFNPISALTHATLAGICRFPLSRDLAASMMTEAQTIGETLGAHFRVSLDRRIAGALGVGEHKTSMLQDVEHGRALELDALVGAVVELGRITGTPTPHIDAVYACASLLARTLQEQKGRLRIETAGLAKVQVTDDAWNSHRSRPGRRVRAAAAASADQRPERRGRIALAASTAQIEVDLPSRRSSGRQLSVVAYPGDEPGVARELAHDGVEVDRPIRQVHRDQPAAGQLRPVEPHRLARQQVRRDRVGAEGVEDDQVGGLVGGHARAGAGHRRRRRRSNRRGCPAGT